MTYRRPGTVWVCRRHGADNHLCDEFGCTVTEWEAGDYAAHLQATMLRERWRLEYQP